MTPYTETEIDFIAGMLQSGATSGQIAAHFEGRSRNAIASVVGRNAKLKAIGFANSPTGNRGGGRKKMADADKATRRAKGRLSEATIRRVRELLHDRVPQVEIAAATGVSQSHVSRIKNGQILAWKGRAY